VIKKVIKSFIQPAPEVAMEKGSGVLQGLQCDRVQYVYQCSVVNNLINSLKETYYNEIIPEHSSDQRALFRMVSKVLV
jgi:hypothetical protein